MLAKYLIRCIVGAGIGFFACSIPVLILSFILLNIWVTGIEIAGIFLLFLIGILAYFLFFLQIKIRNKVVRRIILLLFILIIEYSFRNMVDFYPGISPASKAFSTIAIYSISIPSAYLIDKVLFPKKNVIIVEFAN